MAESAGGQSPAQQLVESIRSAGEAAYDPQLDQTLKASRLAEYEQLLKETSTVALIPALNTLIKPGVVQPWLREPLLQILTRLPLRRFGVRATLEFIFSVHPSNVGRAPGSDGLQKQGANITREAVAVATNLLSSVPAGMSATDWFGGISSQITSLIDGEAGPDVAKTAAQIVGFGILGKRQYGAPGAPGWVIFVQPLLESINPSLRKIIKTEPAEEPDIVNISKEQILTSSTLLGHAISRLKMLILSNPAPGLCRRLLSPVISQIWILASWTEVPPSATETRDAAQALYQTYLKLFGSWESVAPLLKNMNSKGSSVRAEEPWNFRLNQQHKFDVVRSVGAPKTDLDWHVLDSRVTKLVDDIANLCSPDEVSSIFRRLLETWIAAQEDSQTLKLSESNQAHDPERILRDLVEVTTLQKLMEKAPEKLVSRFDQLLELIIKVLTADERSALGDEIMAVVLSLLNLVIGAPTFRKTDISDSDLDILERCLGRLSGQSRPNVAPTAKNLKMLLKYRSELDAMEETESSRSEVKPRTQEDRKTYDLAMNYITGIDNPAPVISEGLNMLSTLILAESPILDITSILVLLSSLLSSDEDYVNLRIVKIFTQLANKHPRSTIDEILEHYYDGQEKLATDVRLRFGEALLQVIEKLGQTFIAEVSQKACETLLSIAGRRGHRAKTFARQKREERLSEMKRKKTGAAAGDEEELSGNDDEDLTAEEKANNDVLARIVQGWESKRGSEDIRMRSSALSIFSAALETNVAGVGANLTSAGVDLCIHVLTLESEPEKAILRRAATIVIISFVRALSAAREDRRNLGFGLTDQSRKDIITSLRYISSSDNDGLVRQNALDVVDSLEAWAMTELMPAQTGFEPPGLTRLAGLNVQPDIGFSHKQDRGRPRIEEIE